MALPVNGSTHLILAYYSFYRPRNDERLSWPSWLTCSGRLTHVSGHPSAAGRAQDRESSPARDRRSTTVPRHKWVVQLINDSEYRPIGRYRRLKHRKSMTSLKLAANTTTSSNINTNPNPNCKLCPPVALTRTLQSLL